ncbi:MAG: BPSS1780 family membrane protein [Gallionella sp.]|nr:BPSS1780 family membrane protein [Gallionella sp.]MDD4946771.1 BPSS1780 family membrane protein [Gallionella sp.]MDD5612223.1 BPSS1780 family membrane protein [Gallionella sp.]
MQIQKMNAARGWIWVKQGYQLILRDPKFAIFTAILGAVLMRSILLIPVVGPLLALIAMPLLIIGYMRVCRALEEDEPTKWAHLWAGFGKEAGRLASLGGLLIVGAIASSLLMLLIGGKALGALLNSLSTVTDQQMLIKVVNAAGPGVSLGLLTGFALMFLLMMAFQYAPMLVYFNHQTPLAAMRAGLLGTLRNFIPYSVYTIIMQLLAVVLGMLPYGIGLIALLPLGLTSLYVSYRNIFPFKDELPLHG